MGEIWLRGPSLARAYWRRPRLSREVFEARLEGGDEGCLRTGDLGFLAGGELYVTGRLKDLIILRGRNHYPQDLEATAGRCHPALVPGGAAAFAVETARGEGLVLFHEIDRRREGEAREARDALRLAVTAEHAVEIHHVAVIRAGALPRTTSGKVRRGRCRQAFERQELANLAGDVGSEDPAATGEEDLRSFLAERLADTLGVARQSLEGAGEVRLDSLAAVQLVNEVEGRFGAVLPLSVLATGASLDGLVAAARVDQAAPSPPTADPALDGPASYHQRSLWLLHRLHPESTAYHLCVRALFATPPRRSLLARSFQCWVDRHAGLRTTFATTPAGELRQKITPRAAVDLATLDLTALTPADRQRVVGHHQSRPFDLGRGPLLRIRLFEIGADGPELLLTAHHIALDLWALTLLLEELGCLYQAFTAGKSIPLPTPRATPIGHARWQHRRLDSTAGEALENSWRQRLTSPPPPPALPSDRPGTGLAEAAGAYPMSFGVGPSAGPTGSRPGLSGPPCSRP